MTITSPFFHRPALLFIAATLATALHAGTVKRLDGKQISSSQVDQVVTKLMREGRVTGLSLALFSNNEIVHMKSYGVRDSSKPAPLEIDTVMYGASLTKPAFAYVVMQLVEERVLNLDKPVASSLKGAWREYPKWADLDGDPRSARITPRMLLSHTSGFANFRLLNPGEKLKIWFEPGSRYAYSGEGLNLLQFVIEEITGEPLERMMQVRVFDRFSMNRTSMVWCDDFAANLATGHDEQGKVLGHARRSAARAAGSMDTTLEDYARFARAFMRGEGLSPKSKHEMLRRQIRIRTKTQFPTLSQETTSVNDKIRLGYGLGWGVFQAPKGPAYFKEGHDDGWENHFVCFSKQGTALLVMTNSSNGDSIFKQLLEELDELIADRYTPWEWEGYVPYKPY